MATLATKIGDATVLLEAPASTAFAKSESEDRPEPEKAWSTAMTLVRTVAQQVQKEVGPLVRTPGSSFEMAFSVRSDTQGLVMISEAAQVGQFQCKIHIAAPTGRPAPRPGPPGGPKARPQTPGPNAKRPPGPPRR